MAATSSLLISFFFITLHFTTTSSCLPLATCGNTQISFPFFNASTLSCGLHPIICSHSTPKIRFGPGEGPWYSIQTISYNTTTITFKDDQLTEFSRAKNCSSLHSFERRDHSAALRFEPAGSWLEVFRCKNMPFGSPEELFKEYYKNYRECIDDNSLYYRVDEGGGCELPDRVHQCSADWFPLKPSQPWDDLREVLGGAFALKWRIPAKCEACLRRWADYYLDEIEGSGCMHPSSGNRKRKPKIAVIVGASAAVASFLLATILFKYRRRFSSLFSAIRSFKSEVSNSHFPTHIFSYQELMEATNYFDAANELGRGGFGTVYRGTLSDGRAVAVKCLYDNNRRRRTEQFLNEVEILSQVQHPNLVTLFGSTSPQSQELLLVYEFIPNGTVADHLHGRDHSKPSTRHLLTWATRMSIAVETAEAIAYLHAIEPPIIHRDIKTNNILLDHSFRVKVADFGLSRLFAASSSGNHVTTAPQGTPGYMDPNYYKFYQLTDKSDVYSFGVVLVELVSSKLAVDMNRNHDEVNLAPMAMNKIINDELHELVDPDLGFGLDYRVSVMVSLVAELAFKCLQEETDMRPSMVEVVEALRVIRNEEYSVIPP